MNKNLARALFLITAFVLLQFAAVNIAAQATDASEGKPTKEQLLFEAIANNDLPAVQKLLRSGIDVANTKNDNDQSPLIAAAENAFGDDGLKILQAVINAGADLKTDGAEALCKAAVHADAAPVQLLLKAGVEVRSRNDDGQTALFGASPENIKLLVDLGLSPNDLDTRHRTPLFGILRPEQVSALLVAGAKANVVDDDGDTPLINAASLGDVDVVKLLLAAGADINAKNKTGETALSRALRNQKINPNSKVWPSMAALLRSKGGR